MKQLPLNNSPIQTKFPYKYSRQTALIESAVFAVHLSKPLEQLDLTFLLRVALSIGLAVTYGLKIGSWEPKTSVGCFYVDGEMSCYELQSRGMNLMAGMRPFNWTRKGGCWRRREGRKTGLMDVESVWGVSNQTNNSLIPSAQYIKSFVNR